MAPPKGDACMMMDSARGKGARNRHEGGKGLIFHSGKTIPKAILSGGLDADGGWRMECREVC